MKISYAIPVCNEINELERLIKVITKYKQKQDEIVILYDGSSNSVAVEQYLRAKSVASYAPFSWHSRIFDGNFADHKNYLNSLCSGDWIFQIDADEYPDEYLIQVLPQLLESNKSVEAYRVPRINTVEGLTELHIRKWGWYVNKEGWVNFPDSQTRLYKNKDTIRWVLPVHEQLVGYKGFGELPLEKEYCLHHPKEIKRQERQNELYSRINNQAGYGK